MLVVKILVIAISLIIFLEDMFSRAVHWFLFPLLAGMLIMQHYSLEKNWTVIIQSILFNFSFLVLQLVIITLWFSLKQKRLVNIANQLLGWGDILFLVSLTVYFSLVNYLLFYVLSLFVVLLIWLLVKKYVSNKQHIPLAGFQALLFALLFLIEWFMPTLQLTNDNWIINKLL